MFSLFKFVDNIKKGVLDIFNTLGEAKEAPSFSMTFNHEYLSGTYKIVDLSWYAPYKEYGDNIICMFAYLAFIWHLFVKASSIINGVDSTYSTIVNTGVFHDFGNKGGK